jgi:hypothetical protein
MRSPAIGIGSAPTALVARAASLVEPRRTAA